MAVTESELVLGMEDQLVVDPNTEISILEDPQFIERYAGVIGLRDNVMRSRIYTGSDRYMAVVLRVSPVTYEARQDAHQRFEEAARRTTGNPDFSLRYEIEPPEDPMSPEEVQQFAERITRINQKRQQYRQLGRFSKLGQQIRLLAGRESLALSMREEIDTELPDIISIVGADNSLREVIIRAEAENIYRSLPPNNWRQTDGKVVLPF